MLNFSDSGGQSYGGGYGYGYSGDRRKDDAKETTNEDLLAIVTKISEMDNRLDRERSPKEEKEFYDNLQMCITLARQMGKSRQEKRDLLWECYNTIKWPGQKGATY